MQPLVIGDAVRLTRRILASTLQVASLGDLASKLLGKVDCIDLKLIPAICHSARPRHRR